MCCLFFRWSCALPSTTSVGNLPYKWIVGLDKEKYNIAMVKKLIPSISSLFMTLTRHLSHPTALYHTPLFSLKYNKDV